MPKLPFEASLEEILKDPEPYVDAVFSCLQSEFLVMPRGVGFVEYSVFERGYEVLKKATDEFSDLSAEKIYEAALSKPICIVVLRTMLGFTPPEWAYVTTQKTGITVTQGFVRSLDRKVRVSPEKSLRAGKVTGRRLKALIETACYLLSEGAPKVDGTRLHRLDKADTKSGQESLRNLARMGAPYAMLLYERFLGRPFAGHRDSISELIGDSRESAIEDILTSAGVSYRKTKRAERVEAFDQAPDFIVPSEFNPMVVIEPRLPKMMALRETRSHEFSI